MNNLETTLAAQRSLLVDILAILASDPNHHNEIPQAGVPSLLSRTFITQRRGCPPRGNRDLDRRLCAAQSRRNHETHISSGISVSSPVGENEIAGFVVSVYDAYGNTIYSGIDFVLGNGAREAVGEEAFQQLESYDNDFVGAANQVGIRDVIEWDYPVAVGFKPNTFVIGIAGLSRCL